MSNLSQDYEITIGIECHVQLATKTKLFSPADNDARDQNPNTCVSPIDYALPGMLPLLNAAAVKLAVRARPARCEIHPASTLIANIISTQTYPKAANIQFSNLSSALVISLPTARASVTCPPRRRRWQTYSLWRLLTRRFEPRRHLTRNRFQPDILRPPGRCLCKELWRIMTYAGVTLRPLSRQYAL